MNRLRMDENRIVLIFLLVGVSILTFLSVNNYRIYTDVLSEEDYELAYIHDAEEGPYGLVNSNMLLPFKNEQEHMEEAIKNFEIYLKGSSDIKEEQKEELMNEINMRFLGNDNLSLDEVERTVNEKTGLEKIFSYIYYDTSGKKADYEQYNKYVSDKIAQYGKTPFFYKYIEFFLLYLVIIMILYVSYRFRRFSSRNYIELYKYRHQLTIRNIFNEILPIVGMIAIFITINNIFYFFYIDAGVKELIVAFAYPYVALIPVFFIISYSILLNIITKRWFISSLVTVALLLYSNMPLRDGLTVKWVIKPFSVLIRYTACFWEDHSLPFVYENLGALFLFSLGCLVLSSREMRKRNVL